jgi:hypothetical protein
VATRADGSGRFAEFDCVFHCGQNRLEPGWLICLEYHLKLSPDGYQRRLGHMSRFRSFYAAVIEQRRRDRMGHGLKVK